MFLEFDRVARELAMVEVDFVTCTRCGVSTEINLHQGDANIVQCPHCGHVMAVELAPAIDTNDVQIRNSHVLPSKAKS